MSDTAETEKPPVVMAFPFLSITQPIEFGPWWLGPLDQYQGPWLSPAFETAARRFLGSFRDSSGKPLGSGALLARAENAGADGVPPSAAEYQALELAVALGVIDQNLFWSASEPVNGRDVATTDNAALWIQPLDLVDGRITLGRGSRLSIMAGGNNLNSNGFTVPGPLELHMPDSTRLDRELVEALYVVLAQPTPEQEPIAARLRVAVRWLMKSWQNTPSITWEDRLVFIKVATEAITREDKNDASAQVLETIFERAVEQEGGSIGTDDLLWQPGQPQFVRNWTTQAGAAKSKTVSAFVHWACALGDARNDLVHGKDGAVLEYSQPGSPYEGPFVEIGDRVVREAIGILLGQCGFPAVWRRGLARASFRALQQLQGDSPTISTVHEQAKT